MIERRPCGEKKQVPRLLMIVGLAANHAALGMTSFVQQIDAAGEPKARG